MKKYIILPVLAALLLSSCVSKKLLTKSEQEAGQLRSQNLALSAQIESLKGNIAELNRQLADLNSRNGTLGEQTQAQMDQLKKTNEELQRQQQKLKQLQDLVAQQSKEQNDELRKKNEELEAQQQKLQQLQDVLAQQNARSKQLRDKMTDALKGYNASDLSITQKNGKLYVRLSENLLFPSGSAEVNPKGVEALSKLAAVLNLNGDVAVNIEGHTDSIPIKGKYKDNWDLSTARATSIVRILTETYKVDPLRVVASGHSYYDPVDSNSTPEGRARNRRTEIILSPKLDEMYKLLEKEEGK